LLIPLQKAIPKGEKNSSCETDAISVETAKKNNCEKVDFAKSESSILAFSEGLLNS
jgi:hypothetical protein